MLGSNQSFLDGFRISLFITLYREIECRPFLQRLVTKHFFISRTAFVRVKSGLDGKILIGFADRRKASYDLDKVCGRKDATTGRNLWWISIPGAEEPDLSILLKNLNPPGTGKKKKKGDGPSRR